MFEVMAVSPLNSSLPGLTGPAGRAVAQPMEAALVETLHQHLTLERQASATYFAMAIWFAERELRGFAHFFKGESRDEQDQIMAASFQMEADVTTSLQQIYVMAERSGDLRSTTFLDPHISGQLASENQFAHLLGRVRLAQNQAAALLILDAELAEGQHEPAKLA